ncbi:MAG TPA: hypothetical protein VGH28_03385 [Polyangiaceae bacterium]
MAASALLGCGSSAPLVNGCDPGAAQDLTAQAVVTIQFGGSAGFAYSPACAKVKTGTPVTFSGDFTLHPLVGGSATRAAATPDPASPVAASFVAGAPGTYPYYCANHFGSGMMGAIFVEP